MILCVSVYTPSFIFYLLSFILQTHFLQKGYPVHPGTAIPKCHWIAFPLTHIHAHSNITYISTRFYLFICCQPLRHSSKGLGIEINYPTSCAYYTGWFAFRVTRWFASRITRWFASRITSWFAFPTWEPIRNIAPFLATF